MRGRRSYAPSRLMGGSRGISPETLVLSLLSCLEESPSLSPALGVSLLLFAVREQGKRISSSHCASCTACLLETCGLWLADNARLPS